MSMYTDDIVTKPLWHPPYYFMVLRTSQYDKESLPVIRHVGPIPELAYAYYLEEFNDNLDIIKEYLYEYHLQDSFGQDALSFCEQRYHQFMKEDSVEEKEVT